MRSKGTQVLNGNSYTNGVREFMNWIPICKLKNLKAYPTFFVDKLTVLPNQVEHIVTIQD
ncbi:MAG: hydrolase, family [Bacillales bacterium]|jgi:hypothetical protein|nr:hydrolase, family [Bacillales bacterium]